MSILTDCYQEIKSITIIEYTWKNILRKLKLVAGKCRKEYKLKFLNFKISVLRAHRNTVD